MRPVLHEDTFISFGKHFLLHSIFLHCLLGLLSSWLSVLLLHSPEGGGGLVLRQLGTPTATVHLCLNTMLVMLVW